jgi:hypothetical protein
MDGDSPRQAASPQGRQRRRSVMAVVSETLPDFWGQESSGGGGRVASPHGSYGRPSPRQTPEARRHRHGRS